MTTPLRSQTLVPFALGLVVLVMALGLGAVLTVRAALDSELEARADSAGELLEAEVNDARQELSEDGRRLAASVPWDGTNARVGEDIVALGADRGLAHVSAVQDGRVRAVDGSPAVARLGPARDALRRTLRSGRATRTTAVTARGGVLLVSATARPRARGQAVLLARPVDRRLLSGAERALGVLLLLDAPGRPAQPLQADGTRTLTRRWALSSSGPAGALSLRVTVSTAALTRATRAALLTTAGAAMIVLTLLIGLLRLLLTRAVLRPLGRLERGLEEMRKGERDVRLAPAGAQELRTLAEGFNDMAAVVGAQQGRLEALAATDPLTGLANHRSFHEALAEATDEAGWREQQFALVLIDLDHFKVVNDTHGHPFGDEVLRGVAERLGQVVRQDDVAARLGGEEFALLLMGAGAEEGTAVAERARASISSIAAGGIDVDSSAGVAVFPDDAQDGERLLDLADAALYRAKNEGRRRTCRFDLRHWDGSSIAEQRAELRALLAAPEQLTAAFQPIVRLRDRRLVGYEALSRFSGHDGRGPAEWFAMARRCGLGRQLEAAAIERALAAPGRPAGVYLAINLDPSDLNARTAMAALPQDLTGIVLELTEHESVLGEEALQARLAELRGRGARIAVDDTGAGYAGLQQIVEIRPDVIKLDRGLITGLGTDSGRRALVESLVGFADRVGAEVCAEGVETREELEVVLGLGVTLGQGYLFGRPAPPWPAVDPAAVKPRATVAEAEPKAPVPPALRDPDPRRIPNRL